VLEGLDGGPCPGPEHPTLVWQYVDP
jgi:hypothetical protein